MSHPPNRGNGCSLEDCHTNLFALVSAMLFFECGINIVKIRALIYITVKFLCFKALHLPTINNQCQN